MRIPVKDKIRNVLRGVNFFEAALVYSKDGWDTVLEDLDGFNSKDVAEAYERNWEHHLDGIREKQVLGNGSLVQHNVYVTFGYVLSLVARDKKRISLLDYGASTGHYYQLSRQLVAGTEVVYSGFDVPEIVAVGRKLNPSVRWLSSDVELATSYDLIMLSGLIEYVRQWKELLTRLVRHCGEYLFIARTVVVEQSATFVCVQRAYGKPLLHQILNKQELVDFVVSLGMEFVREFLADGEVPIRKSPEGASSKSFLFRKRDLG